MTLPSGQLFERIRNEWDELDELTGSAIAPIPKTLMLELTNACNLDCVMCQNIRSKRKRGFMDPDLARIVLTQGRQIGMEKVALYSTGESLLHPDFVKILAMAKDLGFYTYLTTNGIPLHRELAREIVDAGLDSIKFSIDGADPETYRKIRGKDVFDTLIENIKTLRRIRDESGSSLGIYAGAVLMTVNQDQMDRFREVFSPLVDAIYFSPLVNQSGQMTEAYRALKISDEEMDVSWKPCKMLWDRIHVSHEGFLTACCVDYELKMIYGNVREDMMSIAWNNPQMKVWRVQHMNGDVASLPLCSACNAPYIQQIDVLEKLNLEPA